MTKNDELSILRECADKLGNNSYCGPWIRSVMAEIEQDIRSDFPPSPSIMATEKRCELELSVAKQEAERIVKQARAEADMLLNDARARVATGRANAAAQLMRIASEIGVNH